LFDPDKVWSKEEIESLIKDEHPLYCIVNKYSIEDLLDEHPQYKNNMDWSSSIPLFTCHECGKKMKEEDKEKHKKYCKVEHFLKTNNHEQDSVQGDSPPK
jgi:hypothetical protein